MNEQDNQEQRDESLVFQLAPASTTIENKYDPSIWCSVSGKYRLIARLPAGKTGLQALQERAPGEFRRIMQHAEQLAADRYRRTYAREFGDEVELSPEEYSAFRKAGGTASW